MRTFQPDDVKLNGTFVVAILAQDFGVVVAVLHGHWSDGDFVVEVFPKLRHVEERCLTDGAGVVAGIEELFETSAV